MEFCFWLDYLPTRHDWYGWVYLTCGLMTTTGWDGMGYIEIEIDIDIDITAIYMKHDTINNQPKKHDATTTTTIYSRYTFMMIPPSFENDNVFFWMDGWMERERETERGRELYNVEKMNLENLPT